MYNIKTHYADQKNIMNESIVDNILKERELKNKKRGVF